MERDEDGFYRFLEVDTEGFVVESLEDVITVWSELGRLAIENPGTIPFLKLWNC
jgi:hypothetical protein